MLHRYGLLAEQVGLCSRCVVLMGFYCVVEQPSSEIPTGMAVGMPEVRAFPAAVDLAKNPLSETHEFRQACSLCYVRTGELV